MKILEAMKIIGGKKLGFMVSFEWKEGCIVRSDHFPDKRAGEKLLATEEEAWALAKMFAKKTKGKVVNIYVIDENFCPIKNYKDKMIENR